MRRDYIARGARNLRKLETTLRVVGSGRVRGFREGGYTLEVLRWKVLIANLRDAETIFYSVTHSRGTICTNVRYVHFNSRVQRGKERKEEEKRERKREGGLLFFDTISGLFRSVPSKMEKFVSRYSWNLKG